MLSLRRCSRGDFFLLFLSDRFSFSSGVCDNLLYTQRLLFGSTATVEVAVAIFFTSGSGFNKFVPSLLFFPFSFFRTFESGCAAPIDIASISFLGVYRGQFFYFQGFLTPHPSKSWSLRPTSSLAWPRFLLSSRFFSYFFP